MQIPVDDQIKKQIAQAQFFMLRYETEFTPCTGITAVSRQERRNFRRGITIAPWCPKMPCNTTADSPLKTGKVAYTRMKFRVNGKACRVLAAIDDLGLLLFMEVKGRFQGIETPYDVPSTELRTDALYFGLAVDELLKHIGTPQQFVWGADWETVPALYLVKERHPISLTLHNTFDECLEIESKKFGSVFEIFGTTRKKSRWSRTALEIGMEIADVVTTVNRGFAWGMRHEPIQTRVMAGHLQPWMKKVVGVNNAAFSPLSATLKEFRQRYLENPDEGRKELFRSQEEARMRLPAEIGEKAGGKVVVISMGRRVAQKQHNLLIESARQIFTRDKDFPLLIVFSTIHGDDDSPVRLIQMQKLQEEFPANVVVLDGRMPYFGELMRAADYNCMPSLYEPHGGAFEGTVIPIARAIDGLAEQICGFEPKGEAARMNNLWHNQNEVPTGFLFREPLTSTSAKLIRELRELLSVRVSANNELFHSMQNALSGMLVEAVYFRMDNPVHYADMVLAAIEKQENSSWDENRGGMMALIEEARLKRKLGKSNPD